MADQTAFAKGKSPFFQRVGLPIGLQLYSLGEEPAKDLDGTLARVAAIGYRDIELPGLLGKSAAELKAAADKAGLAYSCLHVPAAPLFGGAGLSLSDPVSQVADAAHALGISRIVMPIMLLPEGFAPRAGETFQTAIARGLAEAGADNWKRTAAVARSFLPWMREWRTQHPKATLREMETELDTRLHRMRARMLEDLALASSAADWTDAPASEHPTCPECGTPLHLRGIDTRTLQTHGGQSLSLRRQHGSCPACGAGLFPPR